MFKTERMKKVVVAGAKRDLRATIEALHRLSALHIEEHAPDSFFKLGSPLPEGEKVAEALLKARGLERSLGLEGQKATQPLAHVDEAVAALGTVEAAVSDLITERAAHVEDVKRLETEVARLRRLSALKVRLETLTGYKGVKVFVGTADANPGPALLAKTNRFEIASGHDGKTLVVALWVATDAIAHAETILTESGFRPVEVPSGSGPIDGAIGQKTTEARQALSRTEAIDAEIARVRAQHGERLLAASEALAAAAEKAGVPVRFIASANSFLVTGYMPAKRVRAAEKALLEATSQRLYIEWTDPVFLHEGHAGAHGHGHDEKHGHDTPLAVVSDDPPIQFAHKRADVKSFTMLLGMHSLPKYRELDPTILMWLTFPIFFGLMVGDVAFGILIALLAWYFRGHYIFGIGGPRVSRMLMLSAMWTFLLGIFMFGEAFGIHFVDAPHTISWEHLLGMDWSAYYAPMHEAAAHATEGEHAAQPHLAFHVLGQEIQLGYFSKLHNVTDLLILSLVIAAIHLNLAIFMGIRNMLVLHGAKHAILGRVSWLILELGVAGLAFGSHYGAATIESLGVTGTLLTNVGWGALALAVLMLLWGEGAIAILELPKLFSNALSYTRLTAVGLSKAGMILAVNTFAFTVTGAHSAELKGVGGAALAVVGYLVILGLGVLAGGLHSMRLQFVEFFGWFYEGGGRAFSAFGDPRRRNL